MLPLNKILILLAAIPLFIYPQVIQTFEVTGNKEFSAKEILQFTEINSGSRYFPGLEDSIKVRAARNFASRGYLHSILEVDITLSPDSQKVFLTLNIKEGDPTYVSSIKFENTGYLDSVHIMPPFYFLEGQVFNTYSIEALISEALLYYENNGYPFAKVFINSVHVYFDSGSSTSYADLIFRVNKSARNKIDKIEISGNSKTKVTVILREIRLKTGEFYSQRRIEELPARLNRLRFFEPVETPSFYINSKDEGVLLISVKEKQTNNFDGIIGYIPGIRANEKGYFTGLININIRNLFGTGRGAAVRWQQSSRLTQEMELRYIEPWIMGLPFNISGNFFQRKQDTTYVQRKYEGSIEFLAAEDLTASFIISTESVIPSISEVPRFTVYNSNSLSTGVIVKYDTRDDPYAPTRGILFNTGYSFSKKRITGPLEFISPSTLTRINLQRFSADVNLYYEIFKRHIAALGIHGRELRGTTFEESDLYRLGGTSTLRGYRENQFLGSRITWTNLEYRFLLTRRSFAFLFFDTGYYLRNAEPSKSIEKQQAFNIGYGLGLSIETGIGVLGVSFALAKGDTFSEGKIHFGIINEF